MGAFALSFLAKDELLELNDAQGNDIGAVNVHRSYHQGIEAGLDVQLLNSIFFKNKTNNLTDQLTLSQTYTFNDFHFDGDPVYGDNRIGGLPIHVYEAELLYLMPDGFYAAQRAVQSEPLSSRSGEHTLCRSLLPARLQDRLSREEPLVSLCRSEEPD